MWFYESIHPSIHPFRRRFFSVGQFHLIQLAGGLLRLISPSSYLMTNWFNNLEIRPPLDFIFQIFQSFGNPVELALCQHAIVQWKGRRTASLPGNGWIIAARGEGGRVVRFEIYKRVRNKYAFDKGWFIIESGDTPGELPFSVITFIKIIIEFLSDYRWRWNV